PKAQPRKISFTLPGEFQTHQVVSEFSFGQVGDARGFHEVRRILSIDDEPVTGEARHALSAGMQSAEDEAKKKLLEDLEHAQLQGSAVDFGPMMLMFTKAKQSDFEFVPADRKTVDSGAVFVLRYRQIAGDAGVTEFRDRAQNRQPFSGEIWL